MSNPKPIYMLEPSNEEDRPRIDFERPRNMVNDWLLLDHILRGLRPVQDYCPINLDVAEDSQATWDLYPVPGTLGLFSERAKAALSSFALSAFEFLEATLGGNQFYFLRCFRQLDCLDRQRSKLVLFRTDPSQIKQITKFVFKMKLVTDPCMFVLPDWPSLFVTSSIRDVVAQAGLLGVQLQKVSS